MTVDEFAQLMQDQVQADMRRRFPDSPHMWESEITRVVPGPVYTKVDVGPPHNMSGRYMIENATGTIYGIKGYGQVHKGHRYGTLATAGEWFWGGYSAQRRETVDEAAHRHDDEMFGPQDHDLLGDEDWTAEDQEAGNCTVEHPCPVRAMQGHGECEHTS